MKEVKEVVQFEPKGIGHSCQSRGFVEAFELSCSMPDLEYREPGALLGE